MVDQPEPGDESGQRPRTGVLTTHWWQGLLPAIVAAGASIPGVAGMRVLTIAAFLALSTIVAAQTMPDESDPLIAAVVVYSTSYSIERWESYCAKESPVSAAAIASARGEWMAAHSTLLQQAATILQAGYSRDERLQIAVQARLGNDELEGKLSTAPVGTRRQWCNESAQRILSPQMDLNRRATLVKAMASAAS